MIDDPEQNRALSLTQDLEIRTLKIHFGWFITLAFLFLHLFFILFYFLFYFQPSRLRDVKEETLFDCRKFVSLTAKPRQANPKSVARDTDYHGNFHIQYYRHASITLEIHLRRRRYHCLFLRRSLES